MKHILTIWGWSGTFNLVSGLKQLDDVFIHTLVTMSDDGGSTWFLRDEYWILPPGDLRRALVALSDENKSRFLRKLFSYRFSWGLLDWQNLWNLIMMAAEQIEGNYGKALDELEEMLNISKGKVYPATFEKTRLIARLEKGDYIIGETNIDVPKHNWDEKIKNFWVIKEEYAKILEKVKTFNKSEIFKLIFDQALQDYPQHNPILDKIFSQVDYIIVWPGDLYTSILPNILVGNVADLLKKSKAKKIFVLNLFTKYGETNWYNLSDFIKVFEKYIGEDIFDYILVQDWDNVYISDMLLQRYKGENKEIIKIDMDDERIIKVDLINFWDIIRHDKNKLAKAIENIITR